MASYYTNEAVLDLPEARSDKTIHGLESKLPGDKTLGVLVHRCPNDGGRTLHENVDANAALNARRLLGYTVLDAATGEMDGVPAVFVRARWRNDGANLYQRQAHVVFGDQAMIFAVAAPLEERATCDETFDAMVRTLTWRTA